MKFLNSELEKKKTICRVHLRHMIIMYRCFFYQLFNLQRVNSVCMCSRVCLCVEHLVPNLKTLGFLLDMVVHTYNPSTQEAKVQRLL